MLKPYCTTATFFQSFFSLYGIICFIFLVLGMTNGASHAESIHYTVYTEELEPVHFTRQGTHLGIATELVQAIFREAGLPMTLESYPWKRSYYYSLHDDNSFIYTINRTTEREEKFHWIGPILPKRTWLYRLKSRKDIKVQNIHDLKNYTTTVLLGYALTRELEDAGLQRDKELVVRTTKKEQLRVLLKGHADLITGNEFTLPRALQGTGFTINDMVPVLLMSNRGYFLAANLHVAPEVITRLQAANQKIQQSGLVQQVINKYMQEPALP